MHGRPWIPAEDRALKKLFPHIRTPDVARILGRSPAAISSRASILGIHKSAAFNASPLSGRNVKGHAPNGSRHRFPKGHVPANKGLRRPGWFAGRMRETQFKKGQFPINKDPEFYVLGALRVNTDGYIDMRTSFDPGSRGWTPLHRILWIDAHGPVPKSHCLRFKDGDKLNVCLENLELISRADNARRNSIHNLPKPLVEVIRLKGQLKRRIREQHDQRSA